MTDPRISLTLTFASGDKPSAVATRVGEVVGAEVAAPLVGMNWSAFDLSETDTNDEPDWEAIAKEREVERDEMRGSHQRACETVAAMHAAATGRTGEGPIRGVVEDVEDVRLRAEQAETERDGAYRERAHLVALLAAMTDGAVITYATDVEEPGWQIVYLTLGGRQASWHISPRDADLFTHVQRVEHDDPRGHWDGHTKEEKYEGIAAYAAELTQGRAE